MSVNPLFLHDNFNGPRNFMSFRTKELDALLRSLLLFRSSSNSTNGAHFSRKTQSAFSHINSPVFRGKSLQGKQCDDVGKLPYIREFIFPVPRSFRSLDLRPTKNNVYFIQRCEKISFYHKSWYVEPTGVTFFCVSSSLFRCLSLRWFNLWYFRLVLLKE